MITVTNSLPKLAAIDSNDMRQAIMTDRAPLFLYPPTETYTIIT